MGTQNGSKLDIRWRGFLIHAFELEIWPSKVFSYGCTGNSYMCICNDLTPPLRYLPMLVQGSHICYNCYVGSCLHWATSGYAITLWGDFPTIFFSAQCVGSLETKKINNLMFGALDNTWGHNFYMGMQNRSKLDI